MTSRRTLLILLPGLGADARLFSLLTPFLPYETLCPKWPLKRLKSDRLDDLARVLAEELRSQDFPDLIYVGFSFGGQVAWELSRYLAPKGIILISSFRSSSEIPWRFRLQVCLSRMFPKSVLRWLIRGVGVRIFSHLDQLNEVQTQILNEMTQDFDARGFLRLSQMAAEWSGDFSQSSIPCLEVAGERDKVIPAASDRRIQTIARGGHLVLLKEPQILAGEMDRWIKNLG